MDLYEVMKPDFPYMLCGIRESHGVNCNRVSTGMVLMGVSRGDAEFALLDLFSDWHSFATM